MTTPPCAVLSAICSPASPATRWSPSPTIRRAPSSWPMSTARMWRSSTSRCPVVVVSAPPREFATPRRRRPSWPCRRGTTGSPCARCEPPAPTATWSKVQRRTTSSRPSTRSPGDRQLPQRLDDLGPKPLPAVQVGATIELQTLDRGPVLLETALALVEAAWLEDLDVVDAGDLDGDLVAEVRVGLPRDRPFGDRLDDGAGVGDGDLLAARVGVTASHPTGVEQEDLEVAGRQQFQEPVPLPLVMQGEEGVRAGHPEKLALFVLAAGARPLRLTEHEIRRRLGLIEAGDAGDEPRVLVEDEQLVDAGELARVHVPPEGIHPEDGASVLGVPGVEEVHLPGVVLRDVLQVRLAGADGAVDAGLELLAQAVGLGEAAVLRRRHPAAGVERHKVVLHRFRVVLAGECRGGLARSREADDEHGLVAPRRRDHLATGRSEEHTSELQSL